MKNSCLSEEFQESLKSDLQQQQQDVEQRRHDLMPEHRKVQKRALKIKSIQDRRRNMQKESAAAQLEIRRLREESDRNEERFRQVSDSVDKYKMAQHNFWGCRRKKQAVVLRKRWIAAWRRWCGTYFRQVSRSGEVSVRCCVPNFLQKIRGVHASCADVGERRRKKE